MIRGSGWVRSGLGGWQRWVVWEWAEGTHLSWGVGFRVQEYVSSWASWDMATELRLNPELKILGFRVYPTFGMQ